MTVRGSADVAWFLADGYSVLGYTTGIDSMAEALLEDTTPLGVDWPTMGAVGVKQATLSQSGFFNSGTGSIHDLLKANQGTSRVVNIGYAGNVIGRTCDGYAGVYGGSYQRQATVKALTKANATYTVSGQVDMNCRILHALAAKVAAGNTQGTPVDNTVSTSTGLAIYLQTTALTLGGYTNVVVKVRHSADNITYADLATLTAVTTAPTALRATVATGTTINRYLAVSYALTGSGSSPSITFMVATKRL